MSCVYLPLFCSDPVWANDHQAFVPRHHTVRGVSCVIWFSYKHLPPNFLISNALESGYSTRIPPPLLGAFGSFFVSQPSSWLHHRKSSWLCGLFSNSEAKNSAALSSDFLVLFCCWYLHDLCVLLLSHTNALKNKNLFFIVYISTFMLACNNEVFVFLQPFCRGIEIYICNICISKLRKCNWSPITNYITAGISHRFRNSSKHNFATSKNLRSSSGVNIYILQHRIYEY